MAGPRSLVRTCASGWRGPLISVGTAFVVLIVAAGSLLLIGRGDSGVVEEPLLQQLEQHLIPGFDQAFSALLTDLDQRGLLDETLVVAVGEMGRTPKANGEWGRGHWSYCFPCVLAGAGVRGRSRR